LIDKVSSDIMIINPPQSMLIMNLTSFYPNV